MFCQRKKIGIKRAALVLFLLNGLAIILQTPALAILPTLPPPTQSVSFAWDPSTDPNVAGFNIYYGTVSHVYTSKVSLENVTTATISGLIEGTTYYFAATFYDALNQESVFSDDKSYTVPLTVLKKPSTIMGMIAEKSKWWIEEINERHVKLAQLDLKTWPLDGK